jgi:L-ornithine N5-oxygenase
MPEGVERGDRVWHNSELLARVDALEGTSPSRFIVVGAGQSAAENVAYLHRRFPQAEVCAVFSRYGYSPADDSSFANRIFDPAAVDEYFAAPESVKRRLMDYHGNTNYSVVDIDLIDDLYRQMYQEKVLGTERLRFLNVSRLADVKETPDRVRATVKSLVTGEETTLDADVVVQPRRPARPARRGRGPLPPRRPGPRPRRTGLPHRDGARPAVRHLPAGRDGAHARHHVVAALQHRHQGR